MEDISVVKSGVEHADSLGRLFYTAVQEGTVGVYDLRQRSAWVSAFPEKGIWHDRLLSQTVLAAKREQDIVGFITLQPDGCIDMFFVHPDCIGCGVSTRLYSELVSLAKTMGMQRLFAYASFMARSFFLKRGWVEIREQVVTINSTCLSQFYMEIAL